MRALLGAALVLAVGCTKKEPSPQAGPEPSTSVSAPVMPRQILKEGGPPDDPMLGNIGPLPMPPVWHAEPVASASNAFGFDLWKRLSKDPGNATFSPASISIALATVWPGAKGETAAQIKKVMHWTTEPVETARVWGKMSSALGSRKMKLRIANRLFGEKTYAFEQPFLDTAKSAFGAGLEELDFKGAPEAGRARINGWVEEKTEQRIKDLLPEGAIDPTSRLVLANAVYFLADWLTPFDKSKTKDEPFYVDGKTEKNVPSMHASSELEATVADGMTMVRLPYASWDASMFVVLPEKRDGIAALESVITLAKLDAWKKATQTREVDLTLPRFEITTPSLSLAKHLGALGMPLVFDREKADLTGIGASKAPEDRLFVGSVFHKAFVHVDEKGTEAAAATGIATAVAGAAPNQQPPLKMTVDHPFLFFIVEKETGLILFMGRVVDPH